MASRFHDEEDWESDDYDPEDDDVEDYGDEDDEDESTMPCPYCEKDIHEDALRCPYCNQYISSDDAPPRRKPWWIIIGFLLCFYVVYRWVVP